MTPEPLEQSRYHNAFKRAGRNVCIAPDVWIEHPEALELGDEVVLHRGISIWGKPKEAIIGSRCSLHAFCQFKIAGARLVVAEEVGFFTGTYLEGGSRPESFIEIGAKSHFAPYTILYGTGGLRIGAYCNVSAHVVFATIGHNHRAISQPMALTRAVAGPITVGEDVWIAANSTICAGVAIADGCVIAANSVLTRSTDPMGLYAGAPARRIRNRTP